MFNWMVDWGKLLVGSRPGKNTNEASSCLVGGWRLLLKEGKRSSETLISHVYTVVTGRNIFQFWTVSMSSSSKHSKWHLKRRNAESTVRLYVMHFLKKYIIIHWFIYFSHFNKNFPCASLVAAAAEIWSHRILRVFGTPTSSLTDVCRQTFVLSLLVFSSSHSVIDSEITQTVENDMAAARHRHTCAFVYF